MRLSSSRRLFCSGVPVSNTRRLALAATASRRFALCVARFFTRCASSRTRCEYVSDRSHRRFSF